MSARTEAQQALEYERDRLVEHVAELRADFDRKALTAKRTSSASWNAQERLAKAEADLARVCDALAVYDPSAPALSSAAGGGG